jgi:polyhydroxyalkanoate synthesis repressor PhaR
VTTTTQPERGREKDARSARVIKRYANRKLYDTQRSRYVTLDQIADMIRSGDDVKIVDNNSKADLTSVTLAQINFEEEKNKKSFLPLGALRNIIQSGGESLTELASHAGATVKEKVRSVFRRGHPGEGGEDGHEDGAPDGQGGAPEPEPPPHQVADVEGDQGGPGLIKEFIERSQQTFDEWQKRVDERVQKVVETLAPWTVLQKELAELGQRLAELEKRLREM